MNQDNQKKNGQEKDTPCNYSFMFYNHPIYSSNVVYGMEDNQELESNLETKEAPDEPPESWGWVNNVEQDY